MRGDIGDFLADAGAVVGGATVLGATLGFIAGSIAQDFRREADPERWARTCGSLGGVFSFVIVVIER